MRRGSKPATFSAAILRRILIRFEARNLESPPQAAPETPVNADLLGRGRGWAGETDRDSTVQYCSSLVLVESER